MTDTRKYIDEQFNKFFKFDTEDRSIVTSTSCKLFAEHLIADLLAVIAKKDEAINGLLNAVENGTWCYETSDCGDDGSYIGNAVSLDSDEVKNAENALALTADDVELVEVNHVDYVEVDPAHYDVVSTLDDGEKLYKIQMKGK